MLDLGLQAVADRVRGGGSGRTGRENEAEEGLVDGLILEGANDERYIEGPFWTRRR